MTEQEEKAPSTQPVLKTTVGTLVTEIDPALKQLGSLAIKNMDAMISIAKLRKLVKTEIELYGELHKQISEADCKKNEAGHPILETVAPGRQLYKYDLPEVEAEVTLRIQQLHEKEVEIPIKQIKAADLKNVEGVSANMLSILSDFILFE